MDNVVYMEYAAVREPTTEDVGNDFVIGRHTIFTKDLEKAREAAKGFLNAKGASPATVVIFKINPILRVYGKQTLELSEQEIQPEEGWGDDV